ncbi:MAG: hypothetical protein HOH77_02865, partial [Candidatus Latescibacteria bacterium]|nr:hypothetical protein [Candidatus Latescibacterota bacterium]
MSVDAESQKLNPVTRQHVIKALLLRLSSMLNLTEQHFLIALAMVVGVGGGASS